MYHYRGLPNTSGGAGVVRSFDFDGHTIRVLDIDGAPWFVAKDVIEVLFGYNPLQGATHHLLGLAPDERRTLTLGNSNGQIWAAVAGPKTRKVALLAKSGLYKLVLRANHSPAAKRFQDWVTREVLPSIRKNGGYIAGAA